MFKRLFATASTILNQNTELLQIKDIKKFPDLKNLWWKSPTVQALLKKFDTADAVGLIELDKSVFSTPIRPDLIKRALIYEKSWREQGTESTKNLGQVRGSTRKPFPQKGRGKARVGTLRAPNFRGGYIVHGPRPHIKTIDLQRKVYNSAIRSSLSAKYNQDQLIVVDSLTMTDAHKATLYMRLKNFEIMGKKVYFIYGNDEPEKNLIWASETFVNRRKTHARGPRKHIVEKTENAIDVRFVPFGEKRLLVSSARNISVTPIMDNEILVLDKAAVEVLEEMYKI